MSPKKSDLQSLAQVNHEFWSLWDTPQTITHNFVFQYATVLIHTS